MMSSTDRTYPIGPDGIPQLVAFWKGAQECTREEMRQRFKAGEFYGLHDGLMKELVDAYDPENA